VALFKALLQNLPGGTEETHDHTQRVGQSPGRDLNPGSPGHEAIVLNAWP
jgi:hypothetical protein